MTKEEFEIRSKSINDRLTLIATRTANMAWMDIAKPTNPDFAELMRLQDELIKASDELIEKYYTQS